MTYFFVSPSGNDTSSGNEESPFRTLGRAQQAAGLEASEVVIYLSPGRYTLVETWFLNEDSFRKCERVTYAAHPGKHGEVIISGAQRISDWGKDCADNIWKAHIGSLDVRQLYVGNRRVRVGSIDELPGTWTRTSTGYTIDTQVHWDSPAAIEFVYSGIYPWTEARCRVASMEHGSSSTTVTMAQPAWMWANELYNYCWDGHEEHGPGTPTRVENSKSFLMLPGTFVCDRSHPGDHVLYYKPAPNEDRATTVVRSPALERLICLDKAKNISFRGLTFSETTWLGPNSGYLHFHGDSHYQGDGYLEKLSLGAGGSWLIVPKKTTEIQHCIALKGTSNVTFDKCTFTKMGGVAVGSAEGCAELVIRSCRFEDLSASGIVLKGSRNTSIEDTTVQYVGMDYAGSPAISLQGTSNCRVDHCHISETPHSGISLGPNFGSQITHNLVCRTMTKLADGGGINLADVQGESMQTGALVRGNVVIDTMTKYNFAIYTDYGAKWVTAERNVVLRADTPAVFEVHPPLQHVVYQDNIWDTEPGGLDALPEGVTYKRNIVVSDEKQLLQLSEGIRTKAGVRDQRAKEDSA